MSRRIAINLGSFLLLALFLTVWAARNYVTFGLTEPPSYEVEFTFSSSPGLREGFDIAYLGVPIGSITDVQLQDQDVLVTGDVRIENEVTADVLASIRRRSAVGEPFIDLSPLPDADLAAGPMLSERPTVPVENTRLPRSYEEVFGTVAELLGSIPTDAVSTITRELAVGLEGRQDDLITTIRNFESVAVTLGDRSDLLDQLLVESADVSDFVAGRSGQLSSTAADLELLTTSLRESREDITALLDEAPSTVDRIAAMLLESRPATSCLLDAVEGGLAAIDTEENGAALRAGLDVKDTLIEVLDEVTYFRPSGRFIRIDAFLNTQGDDLRTGTRAQPPASPAMRVCDTTAVAAEPGAGPAAVTAGEAPPLAIPSFDDEGDRAFERSSDDDELAAPDSSEALFPERQIPVWILLVPLALSGLLAWRPWSRRG